MTEHNLEEQEMEAEALTAIFEDSFEVLSSSPPKWSVKLVPVDTGGDMEEHEKQNHVAVNLIASLPKTYPEEDGPELDIEVVKGLAEEQRQVILKLAQEEADANAGMPALFTICEAVRTWLADNNVKGQDDGSMYAQMMRKAKEAERTKAQAEIQFEAQKKVDVVSQAEAEEQAVRKRRAEGTPVTTESFEAWKAKFEAEMVSKAVTEKEEADREGGRKAKEKKGDDATDRLTGKQQFSGKAVNLEAIEAATEAAEVEGAVEGLDLNEELFDEDDDSLDDLDFDDDEEDEDDDEEPDI